MAKAKTVEQLRERIEGALASEKETLQGWVNSINPINPLHAFSWSGDAFQAAARISLLTGMLGCFDDDSDKTLSEIEQYFKATLIEMAWRGAEFPSHSTSPTANLAEQETARAAVWVLDHILGFGGYHLRELIRRQ